MSVLFLSFSCVEYRIIGRVEIGLNNTVFEQDQTLSKITPPFAYCIVKLEGRSLPCVKDRASIPTGALSCY